jgi:sugar lactone lactonase YvrE
LGSLLGAQAAWGQDPDGSAAGPVLAQFEDARALAVDPRGRLYVADAGRDVVDVLNPDGTRRAVLGGPGTRPGAFDTPSDVDPTNGQLLLVADTYNGRIQRFSGEGQYLESLPVGRSERGDSGEWTFEDGRGGAPAQGRGAPISVARDEDGALFVLDARDRRLLRWSAVGQAESRLVGRAGQLQDPVALAVGPGRRLYVADAGQAAVLVYDTFGTVRRRVSGLCSTMRALTVHRERLWIACEDRVLAWDRTEGLVAAHPVDLGDPLVDVAFVGGHVYLLTETTLRRRRRW